MAEKKTGLGANIYFNLPDPAPLQKPAEEDQKQDETSQTGRKKRSDYKGAPRRDYHDRSRSVMLGVRLPADVAEEVRRRAEAQDQSVNAWLAQLVMQALERPE